MSCTHGSYADLPAVVLEYVFSYLTVPELFHAIKVCTTWQTVLNRTHCWFRKIQQLGINHLICPELKGKLLGSLVDLADISKLLQGICLYKEDRILFLQYFGGTHIDDGNRFNIYEKDIFVASVQLLFHMFSRVSLRLDSRLSSIKNINLLLLVLSYTFSFEVHIRDRYSWRNRCISSNHLLEQLNGFKNCKLRVLCTAVSTVEVLPSSVMHLRLGLLVDSTTESVVQDPGIDNLGRYCPNLTTLGIHVKAGTVIKSLSRSPEWVPCIMLYISEMSEASHLEWAVDLAIKLDPLWAYHAIFFPSCKLKVDQLCELVRLLADAGIKVKSQWEELKWEQGVHISSPHSNDEYVQLHDVLKSTQDTNLTWYQKDKQLNCMYTGW